jgi:hypothetical protein
MNPKVKEAVRGRFDRGNIPNMTKISPNLAVKHLVLLGTEKGNLENPGDQAFVDAYNETSGRALFSDVDIPEVVAVRQLYNSWGTALKQIAKDKSQTGRYSKEQFMAELKARVKLQALFNQFSNDDLDNLLAFVWNLVEVDKTLKTFGSMRQFHVGKWTMANGRVLSQKEKKALVEHCVHEVGKDKNYMANTEAMEVDTADCVDPNDVCDDNEADLNDVAYMYEENVDDNEGNLGDDDRLDNAIFKLCDEFAIDESGESGVVDDDSDVV